MNKRTSVLVAIVAIASTLGFAQQADSLQVEQLEKVVITDSRHALKRENSGKTVISISAEELKNNSGKTIAEIINTKSGISINGSQSNAGQPLTTFVRGGQNRQVLVLIDGIAVSDPSQIENNYDLQLLAPDQIESIEILKGASSVLYGNRASTAVINITLKKAFKKQVSATFSSSFATNNSQEKSRVDVADFTNAVGINGTLDKLSYLLNFSNKYTDGLSAIKAVDDTPENTSDTYSKIAGNLKLGYTFTDQLSITAFTNFDKYRTGFDDSFGFVDAENVSKTEQFIIGVSPKFTYNKGSFNINAAINTVDREFESSFPSIFESQSIVIDAFNKYKFDNTFYTIIGLNYIKTEMDSFNIPFGSSAFQADIEADTANDVIIDPYINLTYLSDFGLNINAGVRLNNHSEYGSHLVYNVNPSYNLKLNSDHSIKVLASYSTAYITPSLFQLFANGFGNDELEPQEDATIEGGLEYIGNKNLQLSAIYFNRKQERFIDFVVLDFNTFEGEYQNVTDKRTVQGVEVELSYKPMKDLDISANYTFTEAKDAVLFRVPKHKANAVIGYTLSEGTYASLSYQFTSERTSPFLNDDFTANRILDSYSLVNFSGRQTIIKNKLDINMGVTNLFNEDYEELYRFTTLGRNYRLGISFYF